VALCHPKASRFPFLAILNVSAGAKAGFACDPTFRKRNGIPPLFDLCSQKKR
jgi:hypothetical protein